MNTFRPPPSPEVRPKPPSPPPVNREEVLMNKALHAVETQAESVKETLDFAKQNRDGQVWVSFAVAIIKAGTKHLSDVGETADMLLAQFKNRFDGNK